MTTLVPDPIHLHRIDLERNMRRFYELSVQPTLFGGTSLVRAWGRIGTAGQSLIVTFDHPIDTTAAFARLERTKRRRGYRDATRAALS
mgnify:FL=1|jgi:predicted DNA-binding WGR domain protein